MPFSQLTIRPGVNTQSTPLLNEGGWSSSNLVRFKDGILQKLGGSQRLSQTQIMGICRGLQPFEDLAKNTYCGIGTTTALEVYYNGQIYNITPAVHTSNLTAPFSTIQSSPIVTLTDSAIGSTVTPEIGDLLVIGTASYAGGIFIQGTYTVASVGEGFLTFNAGSNATSTTNLVGPTYNFATTSGSNLVVVSLGAYTFTNGQSISVYVSTIVGGVTLYGSYTVTLSTSGFGLGNMGAGAYGRSSGTAAYITASTNASSTTSGYENADQVEVLYGLSASQEATSGYGIGLYGEGLYGVPTGGVPTTLRQWSMDNWGGTLVASPTNLGAYVWTPTTTGPNIPIGVGNEALPITNAPPNNTGLFVSMPQRQLVCFGSNINTATSGTPTWTTQDPLLINFSDIEDYTTWTASASNQAGSYRLPSGSRIISAIQSPLMALVWTDIELWAMTYLQYPLVYGFNKIGIGCGSVSLRSPAKIGPSVYWMSQDGFFMFDGNTVVPLRCTVWDQVFNPNVDTSLDLNYVQEVFSAPNSYFNEVSWFYPTVGSNGSVTNYVTYNVMDQVWYYGSLNRTAWTDQSALGAPIAAAGDTGYLDQHETSNDNDGEAMDSWAQTGWFKLSEGSNFMSLYRILPDFILSSGATVLLTVYVVNYVGDTPTTFGPFPVTSTTDYVIIRGRGRYASIKVESQGLGSFWRLGKMLAQVQPAGRR